MGKLLACSTQQPRSLKACLQHHVQSGLATIITSIWYWGASITSARAKVTGGDLLACSSLLLQKVMQTEAIICFWEPGHWQACLPREQLALYRTPWHTAGWGRMARIERAWAGCHSLQWCGVPCSYWSLPTLYTDYDALTPCPCSKDLVSRFSDSEPCLGQYLAPFCQQDLRLGEREIV